MWTEEPGSLQFIGSQRVGHDLINLAHTHTHKDIVATKKHNGRRPFNNSPEVQLQILGEADSGSASLHLVPQKSSS